MFLVDREFADTRTVTGGYYVDLQGMGKQSGIRDNPTYVEVLPFAELDQILYNLIQQITEIFDELQRPFC